MQNPRKRTIEYLIEHSANGSMDALKDLVKLLQPLDNPQQILSRIFLSEKCTEIQRDFILDQKHLFSRTRLDQELRENDDQQKKASAMNNLLLSAKDGNMQALIDLCAMLSPSDYSQKTLSDIYSSENSTVSQREFILSQTKLFSKRKLIRMLGIERAKAGDLEALSEIIAILKTVEVLIPHNVTGLVWVDAEIVEVLEEIFLSKKAHPEQKHLIWSHKNVVVVINREVNYEEEVDGGYDADGNVHEYKTSRMVPVYTDYPITFYEYIKPKLSSVFEK